MKLAGDVSKEDREMAEELDSFEHLIDQDTYDNDRKAQMYVSLAHDWYQLEADEEGDRLLLKADKVFPGYFKGKVLEHQQEDEIFDTVIKNITLELARLLTDSLRKT